MKMIKSILMEAKSFYSRNVWLTGICVIGLTVTTMIVFFSGLGGICSALGMISILLGFIMFFRLGCTKRHFFDVEDMLSCLFNVFLMNLHNYLAENEFYEISSKQQGTNFLYRLLLGGVFFGLAFFLISLLDGVRLGEPVPVLHPFLAIVWVVLSVVASLIISAFLERRYKIIYGSEKG